MKAYLTYKTQIKGFSDVAATVKMTEKIAASTVHRLKHEVLNLQDYIGSIERVLARLSRFYVKKDHVFFQHTSGNRALVVLSGDKGLVGDLWHSLARAFVSALDDYRAIIVLGKRGSHYLREEHAPVLQSFKQDGIIPTQEEIALLTKTIFDGLKKKAFTRVDILYPRFVSLAQQKAVFVPFVPFAFQPDHAQDDSSPQHALGIPIFEPSRYAIFDRLLQKYMQLFVYKLVLETKLSECSARTVAMEHASVKTKELIQTLNHDFKKEQRRLITQRQLESFATHRT
ncbi:F0F1 ATP synthase subunit gamma [Candidatus Woesebacteria bacterium]|nr:F0F1 ATP synthase subunit gamma [Candidatus Woesebacteria bacterium]